MTLEIRLLGQFDVRLEGAPAEIPSRPAQSLLAYLTLNPGTAHRREKLAGLLWPDATEANARGYLRKALWQLRKSLAEDAGHRYLLADEMTITFDAASEFWLDAADLEAEAAGGSPVEAALQAVSVYRGDLLPGFYDEWVALERERLRAVFDQRMDEALAGLVEAGRWPEVLAWGERWIGQGGVPEPAYRALMTAHAALGDRSKVATVYER